MRKIYKYGLTVNDETQVSMPVGAEILAVMKQNGPLGQLQLWAIVDDEQPLVAHKFVVRGTGHPLPLGCTKATHLGTVFDGPLVWHIFRQVM